jgi:hypothetical protein
MITVNLALPKKGMQIAPKSLQWEDFANSHKTDIFVFDTWRDEIPEDLSSLDYGDLDPAQQISLDCFYVPSLLAGSDYSGGSVTVANKKYFLEIYGDHNEKENGVWEVFGGHGTYAIAIRLRALTDEMIDEFNALDDYPCFNDEIVSEVEMEAENEAWDSWAKHDFRRELAKQFPQREDEIYDFSDEQLFEIFHNAMERTNTYWENETGNSAYVDFDRILKGISEQNLTERN